MFLGPGLALLVTLRGQCDSRKGWNCPLSPLQMKQVKSQTDVCGLQTEVLVENRGVWSVRTALGLEYSQPHGHRCGQEPSVTVHAQPLTGRPTLTDTGPHQAPGSLLWVYHFVSRKARPCPGPPQSRHSEGPAAVAWHVGGR